MDDTETGAVDGAGGAGYNKVEEGATVAKGVIAADAAAAVAAANTTAACTAVAVDAVVVDCEAEGDGTTTGGDRDVFEGSMVVAVVIMEAGVPVAAPVVV